MELEHLEFSDVQILKTLKIVKYRPSKLKDRKLIKFNNLKI